MFSRWCKFQILGLNVDYFNQKIIRYPIKINYETVEKKEPINEKLGTNEPLKEELQYFIRKVKEKIRNKDLTIENIGEENYYTTKACELSIKSAETGKEMMIKWAK